MSEETKPEEGTAIDDSKPQVIWKGNTLILILPLETLARPMARGILLEADGMVRSQYAKMEQAKAKSRIVPASTIQGKLAKVFGR